MKQFFFQCQTKSIERLPDGKSLKIKGFASTPDLDRHDDIVMPEAFVKTLNDYKARGGAPALLRGHNPDYTVGKMLMDGEDAPVVSDGGLLITGIVTDKRTVEEAEAGELSTFSIGYIPIKSDFQMRPTGRFDQETGQELFREARILKELDLVEVSLVSTPANPNALFTVTKSLTKMFNSLPSPSMKVKCDICQKEEACGRVGTRFIGKECIDKMQFKSDEVTALPTDKKEDEKPEEKPEAPAPEAEKPEAEKPEEKPEEKPTPSKPESAGETPAEAPKPEEGGDKGAKGEGKVIVSKEDKERITKAAKTFAALDEATASEEQTKEEAPATKTAPETVQVNVDTKQLGEIFASLASVLQKFSGRLGAIETVLKTVPVYKGKSIMAFSAAHQVKSDTPESPAAPTKAKKEEKGADGFVKMLRSARHSGAPVTITAGEDDEDE